ncbi:hypothetical protein K450DRAFT_274904 [Umbelopsis ramanniana AG]|uniref:Uncharacterized protein n=1 Tax=Umbelopsis ramanniana AG TaxID=1314678 RepID=A0AAD5E5Y3_UMBRA|nr:uncharacterized protein K450DRAFT_274904 [Umbelopsis ramanniana AG]KAI8576235.1 hypothetical protein K450DRAFT_274904 [Umbelopsis ramanniana AG]
MHSHARDLVRVTSLEAGHQAAPPQEYPLQISAINFPNSSWPPTLSPFLKSSQSPPKSPKSQVPPKYPGLYKEDGRISSQATIPVRSSNPPG